MVAISSECLPVRRSKPFYRHLYVQVLFGLVLGALLGIYYPQIATNDWIKALGEGFIKLIKMVIAPIIFCTVVSGIAHVTDAKKVGRVGIKALIYFEVVSTFALLIGLVIGNLVKPGAGFSGQVLLFAILFGFALLSMGQRGERLRTMIDEGAQAVFGVIGIVMKAAPFGAFGAMAFTIGKFGHQAIFNLISLIATCYAASLLFILVVLGSIAAMTGFNILKFLRYIKDELLIVLGTSSSESALPQLMQKLERLGCSTPVVGLVVPTGYSFNLDGTNIYMTLATLFVAQALGVDLNLQQQMTIIVVAMLTSKGASGITGAGFITLAATLAAIKPELVPGMAIVLGIDKFMSENRALTNIIGNGVATIVVAAWEGELDRPTLKRELDRGASGPDVSAAS
jgi:aerobic C4-dicarboxylate transport protein